MLKIVGLLTKVAKVMHIRDNSPDATIETNNQGYGDMDELDTKQAAEKYKVTEVYIRQLIQEGKIKAQKVRRDWIINPESLEQYMSTGRKWKWRKRRKKAE